MKIDLKQLMDTRLDHLDFTMDHLGPLEPKPAPVIDIEKERVKKHRAVRRPFIGLVAACLCVVIAMSTLAVSVPEMKDYITGLISPGYQTILEPVEMFCDNNGIRMEIVSAASDGENTMVLLAFQDLEEDRITDIITPTFASLTHVQEYPKTVDVAYDEVSKTAMIMLNYTNAVTQDGMIQIRIKNLATGVVKEYEPFDTEIDLKAVKTTPDTKVWPTTDPGFVLDAVDQKTKRDAMANAEMELLAFSNMNIVLPGIDFATISNIGFLNGKLHVQLCYTRRHLMDSKALDFGSFCLVRNDALNSTDLSSYVDTKLLYSVSIASDVDYRSAEGNTLVPPPVAADGEANTNVKDAIPLYIEYVYDLTPEEAEQFRLMGVSFRKDETVVIEGDWDISFEVKTDASIIKEEVEVEMPDYTITNFIISPMMLKLEGKGDISGIHIEITFTDGSTAVYYDQAACAALAGKSFYYDYNNNTTYIELIPKQPIPVDHIEHITINGVNISYKVV